MDETPIQILEVRGGGDELGTSITLAVSSRASAAIFTALSEQLDRRRAQPLEQAEDVQRLRQASDLVERIETVAGAGAHAVVQLSPDELRDCLMDLTSYADRMDVEGYQPPELRERLQLIAGIIPVLWDANAAATARPLTAGASSE